MANSWDVFVAEDKARKEREKAQLSLTYSKAVALLEEEGIDVFTPSFDHEEMSHRGHIISTLKKLGWKMTHWSVATHNNVAYGYPVFEKDLS